MKNKVVIIILAAVVIAGTLFCVIKCGKTPTDDMLTANLAAISQSEVPDFQLKGGDSLLLFEPRVADLGRVEIGSKNQVVFGFTNAGSGPVVITNITTTCGCTSATWDKAPLMPGDRSEINVTFEAEEKGVFFKKLYIYYASSASPLEIAIRGAVK